MYQCFFKKGFCLVLWQAVEAVIFVGCTLVLLTHLFANLIDIDSCINKTTYECLSYLVGCFFPDAYIVAVFTDTVVYASAMDSPVLVQEKETISL